MTRGVKGKNKIWRVNATINLKKRLDEARVERIKNGLDKEMKSYTELLDASSRFIPLWDILKKAEIKKEGGGNEK